jgi:hypothetical protein
MKPAEDSPSVVSPPVPSRIAIPPGEPARAQRTDPEPLPLPARPTAIPLRELRAPRSAA